MHVLFLRCNFLKAYKGEGLSKNYQIWAHALFGWSLIEYYNIIKDQHEKGILLKDSLRRVKKEKGNTTFHTCGIHINKGYYQSSHIVRCFHKNEEIKARINVYTEDQLLLRIFLDCWWDFEWEELESMLILRKHFHKSLCNRKKEMLPDCYG